MGDLEVRRAGQGGLEQCPAFVVGSAVMGGHQPEQIALGLVSQHFDQIGQVLAFGRQFDDGFCRSRL